MKSPQSVLNDAPPPEDIARRIVERFRPRRILLFGSHARNEAGSDSDLDLFVEMESELTPPERRTAVSSLFWPRTWALDVVVYTPEEVARVRGGRSTLLASIEEEGRLLYERP